MEVPREAPAQALFTWGANSYGQLGLGHREDVFLPQVLKGFLCNRETVKNITGGGGHSAVLTDTGELFLCGQNKNGQLGLGHTEDVTHFKLCSSLCGCSVIQVACGWDFTIILAGSGQVFSCGSNSFGQLGISQTSEGSTVSKRIESLQEKVVNVAAGLRHALAVTENGSVFQWGIGMSSQAKRACQGEMVPSFLRARQPCKVTGLEDARVKIVASGSSHATALTDEGELYVWGNNKHKQLVNKDDFVLKPQKIDAHYFGGEKVRRVWNGWTHMVAQTEKVFLGGKTRSYIGVWPQRNPCGVNSSVSGVDCVWTTLLQFPGPCSRSSPALFPGPRHGFRHGPCSCSSLLVALNQALFAKNLVCSPALHQAPWTKGPCHFPSLCLAKCVFRLLDYNFGL
ncbi:secretion-regulating guanine nucleotide exchange factor isoform X2 [Anolis carolinensis]|uniref:secretion-regulating guanine nucleotide exchange factor isoform X2 n=1 Tax=Anolis carolinensis TaxID=28377 RepID=UPI002F2B2BBB